MGEKTRVGMAMGCVEGERVLAKLIFFFEMRCWKVKKRNLESSRFGVTGPFAGWQACEVPTAHTQPVVCLGERLKRSRSQWEKWIWKPGSGLTSEEALDGKSNHRR